MYSIDDITVYEYFTMSDTGQYDLFINILKPDNKFAGHVCNTDTFTFDEVQLMRKLYNEPSAESMKELFVLCCRIRGNMVQSAEEIFYSASVFDLFRCQLYLHNFIDRIVKMEKKWLVDEVADAKLEVLNASERLAPFSHLLTKSKLAKDYGTTPTDIGTWNYSYIFTILVANKVSSELQKEYQQMK